MSTEQRCMESNDLSAPFDSHPIERDEIHVFSQWFSEGFGAALVPTFHHSLVQFTKRFVVCHSHISPLTIIFTIKIVDRQDKMDHRSGTLQGLPADPIADVGSFWRVDDANNFQFDARRQQLEQ